MGSEICHLLELGMKSKVCGESNSRDLLLLLGWGEKLDNHGFTWLVDLTTSAGFRTHVVESPNSVRDFGRDYVQPVKNYQAALGDHIVIGYSLGGLIAAYLNAQQKTIYLSPFWGIFGHKLMKTRLALVRRLGLNIPLIPIDFGREEVGDLATEADWESVPKRATPVWLREILKAQENMPPIQQSSVAFCSLKDTVVSLKAIGEKASNVILYDGHHELYSSSSRELYREELLKALLE
jgi:pimeloyl-ACP methyl ester carboxylesterase